uniref:Beta-lactamase n=1 Tax=Rhodopseudomonas palustris (strain BisA53) TaxID=316055 RepID=Q07U52_RHOP5
MSISVFDRVVNELQVARDSAGANLKIDSIICTDSDGTKSHHFCAPQHVNLRSIAKPIVCLALGVAIDEGMTWEGSAISLETLIWPFLSRIVGAASSENAMAWSEVTLRDLLRSTIGHEKGLLFSKDIKGRDPDEFLSYIVNYPILGRVGNDFVYSNAGVFILSNLISTFSGMDLDRFVSDRLLARLGIVDVKWDRYGQIVAGCTGLWMSNEDLHKIGQLLLNNGNFGDRQIVSESYVKEMRTPQVSAPTHRYVADRAFPKWSYGLCLWITEDGNFYCDGTNGQYLIVLPRRGVVVTVVGNQEDTVPVSDALGLFKQPY